MCRVCVCGGGGVVMFVDKTWTMSTDEADM